ncbi:MAG: hypothetical protein C4532_15950 [Candidatus Abyssobacteria bacterium SURF_17]|uniref:Ig-like domain-containing protein n=1 Tax=Candidatus Abyssobacteria bacterium SURF_17 TaxID=2093361 RepID=A0A419ESF6_9BACT|nr:MAG: hypothetical protein C4532_15950 [Candidatus Abyssubacteria bacterium SURF_17]
MLTIRKTIVWTITLLFILSASSAWAVTSTLWEADSREDFEAGEPDGVSIRAPGEITLGPSASVTMLDALYAWTLAEDSKKSIYAGTGNDGKIFKIPVKGEPTLFADLELQQVFALAVDARDTLYAAGFPGGKIYAINTQGAVSEYADTGQNAVWALSIGPDGTLFAGTGDEGQIFKIEPGGKATTLYDSPERRILTLISDDEGNLYAGSEQNGIIYRIDPSGRPFVFCDTDLEEIVSMTFDADGNLFAVSSPGELFMKIPPVAVPSFPRPSGEGAAEAAVAAAASQQPQAPGPMPGMPAIPSPKKRTCIVYKIAKDGAATKFWTSPEKLIFSIALSGDTLLAGSGDEGIVYEISPTREAGTYYKADQKQVLKLHRSHSGAIVASLGNDAGIIRFSEGYAAKGTFISNVHDATAISRWGRVFWEADVPAGASLSVATRSGNSETPDDTWSEWSEEHKGAEGFDSVSPAARYVQWRVLFSTSDSRRSPVLRKVTVAYLQSNLAPTVQSVTVGSNGGEKKNGSNPAEMAKALAGVAAGGAGQEEGAKAKATKEGVKTAPAAPQTKVKVKWEASDENGDTLEYAVYFKGLEETRWKLLKDELTEKTYEWDTEAVPDGEYHIKVAATDSPSNPEAEALTDERVSEPFTIDNTPPRVEGLKAARTDTKGSYQITCTVSDNLSPVRTAHYSVDAGDWMPLFPADGIFDSPSERVEFTLDSLEQGEHTIVVKATDYFGNVGAGKITFTVK